jgi:hypothetical protein
MAIQQNLYIDQGATFSTQITLYSNDGVTPLNITTASFASQMRKSYSSSSSVTITCGVGVATNGELILSLTDSQTSAIKAGRYIYDVEMLYQGQKIRAIEGIITVTPQITQI